MKFYRCKHCGQIVAIVKETKVPVMCCGEAMEEIIPGVTDAAVEKHVPVVEAREDGILVKVGSIEHPMTEEHYIEWIEVINGAYVNRYYLKPGELPQAAFYVPLSPKLIIRASCNIHGLWKKP